MSPSVSEGLNTFASLAARIEEAGHGFDDLEVVVRDGTPTGRAALTVGLVDGESPDGLCLRVRDAAFEDGELRVQVAFDGDEGKAIGQTERRQEEDGSQRNGQANESSANDDEPTGKADHTSEAAADDVEGPTKSDDDVASDAAESDDETGADDAETATGNDGSSSTDDEQSSSSNDGETTADGGEVGADRPAYRDPEALAAVYDEDATFADMTRELGVDVTPQTVRKYMIEHGVHEPQERGDRIPESSRDAAEDDGNTSLSPATDDEGGPAKPSAGGSDVHVKSSGSGFVKFEKPDDSESEERSSVHSANNEMNDEPDDDKADDESEVDGRNTRSDDESSEKDDEDPQQSTDVDAARSEEETDGEHDFDPETALEMIHPINLPEDITLEGIVDVVTRSRTVYEVQRELELDGDRARQLLRRCDLIDLVTGRINRGQEPPSRKEVISRLLAAFDDGDAAQA